MTIFTSEPWVISEAAFNTLLTSRPQNNETAHLLLPTNVLDPTSLTQVQNDVAIISVVGPLFKRLGLVSLLLGGSSYEVIAQAFNTALTDPNIKGIILDIDSPGGEVNGCSELANLIYEARNIKPIKAYASGACASGAYWIGSACDELAVSETSCVGSIGVVAAYYANKTQSEIVEIVSSQSPFKCLDPKSDEGRLKLQKRIDALAEVFIQAVARHRGVDPPVVIKDFGGGDVLVGEQAVKQGLADKVSTLKKTITSITANNHSIVSQGALLMKAENKPIENKKLDLEILQAEHPQLVSSLINQGVTKGRQQERKRIGAIVAAEPAKGREKLAHHLAFATELPAEMAVSTLNAAPVEAPPPPVKSPTHGFERVMASIKNPKIEPAQEESPEDPNVLAKRIASFSKGGQS